MIVDYCWPLGSSLSRKYICLSAKKFDFAGSRLGNLPSHGIHYITDRILRASSIWNSYSVLYLKLELLLEEIQRTDS